MHPVLLGILERIRAERLKQMMEVHNGDVNEFNAHVLRPPFPVVVEITRAGTIRVLDTGPGMTFLVDSFSHSADGKGYLAHVRDYRHANSSASFQIWSLRAGDYRVVSDIPDKYMTILEAIQALPVLGVLNVDDPADPRNKNLKL